MKNRITIVGAGMAGLLAANLLRTTADIRVVESQKTLPNNHSAVLRFRSSIVGDKLGIPFREVAMIKDVVPWKNLVSDALAYSLKNTGVSRSDRSITAGRVMAKRYIAPHDLIERMETGAIKRGAKIEYGHYWQPQADASPVISTLPLPLLATLLKWPGQRETVNASEALTVRARLRNCDAFVTLMFPDPEVPFSRASITGDELIVEVPRFNFESGGADLADVVKERIAKDAARAFGLSADDVSDISAHRQPYAKIMPMKDDARKEFIYWATHAHNVYSLGRFATWRPGLLMDDLVRDIDLISGWIGAASKYSVAKHRS